MAVEDELVLTADEVAEREIRSSLSRARVDEHLLALLGLADVERRRREVDEQLRAREREVGRRRPRLPDVLADREPHGRLSDPEEHELAPCGEVAVLVEDAVVREEVLAVDRRARARSRRRHTRSRGRGRTSGSPDERGDALRLGRDRLERLVRCADEAGPQEKVLGRVARRRELREDDEIGAGGARLLEAAEDPGPVAPEIPDDAVELCERDPQGFRLTVTNPSLTSVPAWRSFSRGAIGDR